MSQPHPVRELIDYWQACERTAGIGVGGKYARHAAVLKELLERSENDVPLCQVAITTYFKDRRAYHVETGWSIAAFQTRAAGYLLKARGIFVEARTAAEVIAHHNELARAVQGARDDRRRIEAENAKRLQEKIEAVPMPAEVRRKLAKLTGRLLPGLD